MKKILHFIISFISNLIPRSRNIFVFASIPDFTDNAYVMHLHLKAQHLPLHNTHCDNRSAQRLTNELGT